MQTHIRYGTDAGTCVQKKNINLNLKMRLIPFLIMLLLSFQSCHVNHKVIYKAKANNMLEPKENNFNLSKLEAVTKLINEKSVTTGLIILHKGVSVYEYGNIKKISYIASCRKSILSILYGKYVQNGTIDLSTTIGELEIDEKDGLLPIEKTATINDLITSRSGVHHVAANGGYDKANFLERGSVNPGEYFVYNNWDFNVAGHILEFYAGRSIYEELEIQLAIPLGFEDWNLRTQKKSGNKKKSQYLAYHMDLSTRDMAKIGQLMLNEGEWNGQQLIPKEWIKKTITTVTPRDTVMNRHGKPGGIEMSYGYMWWLFDNYNDQPEYKDAYSAMGYGGQYISVFPKIDVVIIHKTKLGLFRLLGLKEDGGWHYWEIMHKIIESYKP